MARYKDERLRNNVTRAKSTIVDNIRQSWTISLDLNFVHSSVALYREAQHQLRIVRNPFESASYDNLDDVISMLLLIILSTFPVGPT